VCGVLAAAGLKVTVLERRGVVWRGGDEEFIQASAIRGGLHVSLLNRRSSRSGLAAARFAGRERAFGNFLPLDATHIFKIGAGKTDEKWRNSRARCRPAARTASAST